MRRAFCPCTTAFPSFAIFPRKWAAPAKQSRNDAQGGNRLHRDAGRRAGRAGAGRRLGRAPQDGDRRGGPRPSFSRRACPFRDGHPSLRQLYSITPGDCGASAHRKVISASPTDRNDQLRAEACQKTEPLDGVVGKSAVGCEKFKSNQWLAIVVGCDAGSVCNSSRARFTAPMRYLRWSCCSFPRPSNGKS